MVAIIAAFKLLDLENILVTVDKISSPFSARNIKLFEYFRALGYMDSHWLD
jgi:hypothetical protein